MNIGDLIIWKGSWGRISYIYTNNAITINIIDYFSDGTQRKITENTWLEMVSKAEEIEVKTNIFLNEEELGSILNCEEKNMKNKLLKSYAKKYKITPNRLIGYGLMESGEIIYTQVVEKK